MAVLLLAACDAQEPPLDHAVVRVENRTGFALDAVAVELNVLSQDVNDRGVVQTRSYGPLLDGATSPYLPFDGTHAYTLTFVSFDTGDRTITVSAQRDDDDIYDPYLGPGRYTYRIVGEFAASTYLSGRFFALDGPASEIEVRVENQTSTPFDELTVWYRGAEAGTSEKVVYGAVAPGGASGYVAVPHSYRYAPFDAVVGADTLRYRVTDYVGETAVAPGRYTYAIYEASSTGFRDRSELVRDGDR